MKKPDFLSKGDLVAIVCPASFAPKSIDPAIELLQSWGLRIHVGSTVSKQFHYFAGTDTERTDDFQEVLNNPEIKAIFAARGGYGTVRIIDDLDFTVFVKKPKWLIGYSDITVLHSHVQACFGIPTIHGQMPLTMPEGTPTSLDTLKDLLFGNAPVKYEYPRPQEGRNGTAQGILTGGNLALLVSILGSASEPDYQDKILFLEDVGEYLYNLDRMLWTLARAKKLQGIKGLILGGFTSLKDLDTPFGMTLEEMVMEKVKDYDYPVAFDFPAGHIDNNHALLFGQTVHMEVNDKHVKISYIK